MKTLIEGGWVVAFNGTSHEVYENGSVMYENDRIVHAGGPYTGTVDTRLWARGKLVSPGFINTHVHTTGNGGDYMLHDMVKNNYRTANYLSFGAPLKGKVGTPPSEVVTALRTYIFLHALKHGSTTIIDVGGQRGDWEGYVRLIETLGVRVYTSSTIPRPPHVYGCPGTHPLRYRHRRWPAGTRNRGQPHPHLRWRRPGTPARHA